MDKNNSNYISKIEYENNQRENFNEKSPRKNPKSPKSPKSPKKRQIKTKCFFQKNKKSNLLRLLF